MRAADDRHLVRTEPAHRKITPTAAMEALETYCHEKGADILVCDPLAELHNAEENDNTAMRTVVAAFRDLARRLNIAVLLLHHDRKGNNAPGDMDRLRGASAISGAVRVLVTLTSMSEADAEHFRIPPKSDAVTSALMELSRIMPLPRRPNGGD